MELDEPLPGFVVGVDAAFGAEDLFGGGGMTPEGAADRDFWLWGGGVGEWAFCGEESFWVANAGVKCPAVSVA